MNYDKQPRLRGLTEARQKDKYLSNAVRGHGFQSHLVGLAGINGCSFVLLRAVAFLEGALTGAGGGAMVRRMTETHTMPFIAVLTNANHHARCEGRAAHTTVRNADGGVVAVKFSDIRIDKVFGALPDGMYTLIGVGEHHRLRLKNGVWEAPGKHFPLNPRLFQRSKRCSASISLNERSKT